MMGEGDGFGWRCHAVEVSGPKRAARLLNQFR